MDTKPKAVPSGRWFNPQLVQLKVTLFLLFGATSALTPYLTIHMQSIGLTVEEVASVYLTLLFTSCLSPPLTGYLIDRFGRYKPVLLTSIVLNAVSHHLIHFIPARNVIVTYRSWNVSLAGDGAALILHGTYCPLQGYLNSSCSSNSSTSLPTYLGASDISCADLLIPDCALPAMSAGTLSLLEPIPPASEYDATFWTYLAVRFVAASMLASTLTITDPIALDMVEQHGGDFGREKLYSSVGMAIFTPLTGLMIDAWSSGSGPTETVYTPAFYTYDLLLLGSLVSVSLMPIGRKIPSESVVKDTRRLLRLPPVLAFLAFLFLLGNFWGFIESYLFVIMKAMGSPNYLLGLTYTVGTVASIPMMYLLERITQRVGHVNLLVVAFFAHALRILGYSWITNPYWCFPIELNEAISCYFMWVVATTYCAVLAPNSLVATLIGIAGMVHFCLGKGVGAFVGGFLIARVGLVLAFRYVGYMAVGCGVLYKLVHLLWLHRYDGRALPDRDPVRAVEELVKRRASILPKVDQFGSVVSFGGLARTKAEDAHDKVNDEEQTPVENGSIEP
ncbi:major facilitator superfamily domain-containing protein 6 [Anopheles gambiae]|uniref:MFS_1_like domain-containing protein n=1 Tax=Anopheles coluzzii TaxID=1518534 RepID=A0A6E8V177_ANOCL|nr:major facilitator superfamily domain-containing protein 6 [Anopheles gambiae]